MEKIAVFNPIMLFNTVGQELAQVFELHDKDIRVLGIANIEQKEKLSKAVLIKAAAILGLNDSFVLSMTKFQENYLKEKVKSNLSYKASMASYKKLKGVVTLLRNEFISGYDVLEDILDFFGVDSEEDIFSYAQDTGVLYRTQNQTGVDEINLSAWIRRCELDFYAQKNELLNYDESKLFNWIDSKVWYSHLNDQAYFKSLPNVLREFGASLILLPYLPKTIYGAVKWHDGHPIIMISDRDNDLATCWFTLFHEFGHTLKHKNELIIDGMINGKEPKGKAAVREREANKFANTYLFKGDSLRKRIFELKRTHVYETQSSLVKNYGVEPLFVGYWMRKAQYYPTLGYHLPIDFE